MKELRRQAVDEMEKMGRELYFKLKDDHDYDIPLIIEALRSVQTETAKNCIHQLGATWDKELAIKNIRKLFGI